MNLPLEVSEEPLLGSLVHTIQRGRGENCTEEQRMG